MIDGTASELLKNEIIHVCCVQCMSIWNTATEEITDSLRGSIGVLNRKFGNIEIFAGKARKETKKIMEHNGCDGLFVQPTGILSGTQLSWLTLLLGSGKWLCHPMD